jgi:hypothetical protein
MRNVGLASVEAVNGPAQLYLAQLGQASKPNVVSRLNIRAGMLRPGADATTLDWASLDLPDVLRLRELLAARYVFTTCNAYLGVLKAVLRMAYLAGSMPHERTHAASLCAASVARHYQQADTLRTRKQLHSSRMSHWTLASRDYGTWPCSPWPTRRGHGGKR